MNFQQYKIIKRLTKFIAFFCGATVLVGSIAIYSIRSISADTACPGAIAISTTENLTNVSLASSINLTITTEFGPMYNYSGQIWYRHIISSDYTGTDIPVKYGDVINSAGGKINRQILFPSAGNYEFYLSYSVNGTGCGNRETNHLSANVINSLPQTPSATNINVQAPDKVLRGQTITVKMTISGANNQKVVMYINKGGSDCPDSSTVAGCWVSKMESYIYDDTWYHETDWTPDSSSNLGNHMIKVKTYDPRISGSDNTTGIGSTYVNVCDGTDINSCGTATGGGTESTEPPASVDLPDKTGNIDIGGQIINFSLNRGSGIGGLISFIINLLLDLAGAAAFIAILVAGVKYITAGGDAAKADKAKKAILYAFVAMLLAIFSLSIVHVVNNLVK